MLKKINKKRRRCKMQHLRKNLTILSMNYCLTKVVSPAPVLIVALLARVALAKTEFA